MTALLIQVSSSGQSTKAQRWPRNTGYIDVATRALCVPTGKAEGRKTVVETIRKHVSNALNILTKTDILPTTAGCG
jgi:hypothetical protein